MHVSACNCKGDLAVKGAFMSHLFLFNVSASPQIAVDKISDLHNVPCAIKYFT